MNKIYTNDGIYVIKDMSNLFTISCCFFKSNTTQQNLEEFSYGAHIKSKELLNEDYTFLGSLESEDDNCFVFHYLYFIKNEKPDYYPNTIITITNEINGNSINSSINSVL